MTTSLSLATAIEKNNIGSGTAFLIALDISVINPADLNVVETLHVVRNTEGIHFNGFNYEPASFDIQLKSESGVQSTVQLVFQDHTRAVQSKIQEYGGGIGFVVVMTVVNSAQLNDPPEIVQKFEVVGVSSSQFVVTFQLGADNAITKTFPRRRQARDFCQFRYKGDQCGYSGPLTTCDLTLKGENGCLTHDNVIRFGAFPGINSSNTTYA